VDRRRPCLRKTILGGLDKSNAVGGTESVRIRSRAQLSFPLTSNRATVRLTLTKSHDATERKHPSCSPQKTICCDAFLLESYRRYLRCVGQHYQRAFGNLFLCADDT